MARNSRRKSLVASSQHSRFLQPWSGCHGIACAILSAGGPRLAVSVDKRSRSRAKRKPCRGRSGSQEISDLIRNLGRIESVRDRPSNVVAPTAGRHISDYDFVAEDYTTHFDQHSRPVASPPSQGTRPGAQKRLVRKTSSLQLIAKLPSFRLYDVLRFQFRFSDEEYFNPQTTHFRGQSDQRQRQESGRVNQGGVCRHEFSWDWHC